MKEKQSERRNMLVKYFEEGASVPCTCSTGDGQNTHDHLRCANLRCWSIVDESNVASARIAGADRLRCKGWASGTLCGVFVGDTTTRYRWEAVESLRIHRSPRRVRGCGRSIAWNVFSLPGLVLIGLG